MTTDNLRKGLIVWKRLLVISVGMYALLLASAVAEAVPRWGFSYSATWLYAWVIFQVLITPVGFVLLLNKRWRQLPLAERLDTAFGYLAVAWGAVFAFGIASKGDDIVLYVVLLVVGCSAIALALSYWWLRRTRSALPNGMRP